MLREVTLKVMDKQGKEVVEMGLMTRQAAINWLKENWDSKVITIRLEPKQENKNLGL
jgi:hypothetical protein